MVSLYDYTLSFSVEGDDWVATQMTPDYLQVIQERSVLTFMKPWKIYDPQSPSEGNVSSAPEDLVTWFETHRYFRIIETSTVDLRGTQRTQIDMIVSAVPKSSPEGMPVVPVFYFRDGSTFFLNDGFKNRILFFDVAGKRIVVVIESPAAEFERFFDEQARRVLDTLQLED